MVPNYDDFLIKRFEQPDEVHTFEKGYFEIVKVGSMTIGRASYEPGWRWSKHVGPATGAASCEVEHIGLVISGVAACQMNDGRHYEMKAGDLFYIGPGHDSWVVGNQPYVSLHFLGAEALCPAGGQLTGSARVLATPKAFASCELFSLATWSTNTWESKVRGGGAPPPAREARALPRPKRRTASEKEKLAPFAEAWSAIPNERARAKRCGGKGHLPP